VLDRSPVRRRVALVYRLPPGWHPRTVTSELSCTALDEDSVARFFAGDQLRREQFLAYLRSGCSGVVLSDDSGWVAYGWLARTRACAPPHLGDLLRGIEAYWLFNFRTKYSHRGRGYFKETLNWLAGEARRSAADAQVFVDAHPRNYSSRRGILASGFEPAGVATINIVGIPRLRWWKWGAWSENHEHPPLRLPWPNPRVP
jgi:GNAT superfamily N-acetyltransferase